MKLTPFLASIENFSRHILRLPLYRYQLAPIQAVINSVLHQQGLEILLIFPRQSGKNEAIAQLLVYLLNLFQRVGGQIVYGAIGDGLGRGKRRLDEHLKNPLNLKQWRRLSKPIGRKLGKAAIYFLSTFPGAFSRGETASLLLVIDELQDQDASHIESVFTPMRASTNATALYLGTVRLSTDALGQKRRELERLQAQDGIQRVFVVPAETVTAENSAYSAFLRAQVDRYGRNHPIVASEYFLEALDGTFGLFPPARRALMQGQHKRQTRPQPGDITIITIDVGGQDEATTDPIAQLTNPGRDYTAATAFRIPTTRPQPHYEALDVFMDQGGRHFESVPGKESVANRLLAWIKHWNAAHVIIDGSGVGEGLASFLAAALGPSRVTIFKFNGPAKAALGSQFLSVIETGRFKYWTDDTDLALSDGWWYWQQAAACGYDLPPGGQFDKALQWGVPNNHKTNTPTGDVLTHDDRLISSALIALADELIRAGKLTTGTGKSATIPAYDPLANLTTW